MSTTQLHCVDAADPRLESWSSAIQSALMRFNHANQPLDFAPIYIFAECNDVLQGGLIATIGWSWLNVDVLFVEAEYRAQGIGARLLARVEAEAKAQGCMGSMVDTFDFQAIEFYRKQGYTQFGELNDMPPGHRRVYLQKRWQSA
jgi:GNAT superfamily N-acetyltransferase